MSLVSRMGGQGTVTVTRAYEAHRDLLTQVNNAVGGVTVSEYNYVNDALGRRTSMANTGTAFGDGMQAFNRHEYDSRSQVTLWKRYFGSDPASTNNPVGLQSVDYAFDNIGNRTSATGAGTLSETYSVTALNQYSQRTVPGFIDTLGTAVTNATVTVNNQAVTRQTNPPSGSLAYWSKALATTNTTSSKCPWVTIKATVTLNGTDTVSSVSGRVFVAKTPEGFLYDADGNLIQDGRWTNVWDAENRLVSMETRASVALESGVARRKFEFAYDSMGRRMRETTWTWAQGAWQPDTTNLFLYDGWNLIRERLSIRRPNGTWATATNLYVWGQDLSGTLQGAGGIGGLVGRATTGPATAPRTLYAYDGNGNVGQMISATNGAIMAHYEYDAFGKSIAMLGPDADTNPFRFSTKYYDDAPGLYYYGSRSYNPSTGRWISRDPSGEVAGPNPYAMADNEPASHVDLLGLTTVWPAGLWAVAEQHYWGAEIGRCDNCCRYRCDYHLALAQAVRCPDKEPEWEFLSMAEFYKPGEIYQPAAKPKIVHDGNCASFQLEKGDVDTSKLPWPRCVYRNKTTKRTATFRASGAMPVGWETILPLTCNTFCAGNVIVTR